MAYNPNFTFADPRLQQAVVQEAQIQAAQQAARDQQLTETLKAIRAERQLNADREERRAERERVIREGEARTAENRRQFDESLKFSEKSLGAQTEQAKTRQAEADEREIYQNVLNEINKADAEGIPTESEVKAAAHGLGPIKMQALLQRRDAKYKSALNDWNIASGEADKINSDKRIGTTDPRTGEKITAEWLMNHNQFKKYLRVDTNGLVLPLVGKPRTDAGVPVAAAPSFHVPAGRPPSDYTLPQTEKIADVERRSRPGTPGFAFSLGTMGSGPVAPAAAPQSVMPGAASPTFTASLAPGPFVPPPEGAGPIAITAPPVSPDLLRLPETLTSPGGVGRIPGVYATHGLVPPEHSGEPLTVPNLIPLDARFDRPAGGFTTIEQLYNRGLRMTESRRDAALRRLQSAQQEFPDVSLELVERPEGFFAFPRSAGPALPFAPSGQDIVAPPVFAPQY